MEIIFFIIVLIYSIVIHEVSHGYVANYLGDPTAKYAGRLTLNPIKHMDPIGSILLPVFLIIATGRGIGWAKPVPVNPFNFRDQKYGSLKVAIAGPASNLIIAIFFGLLIRFFIGFGIFPQGIFSLFAFIVSINILLALFNLIPIPPLDGSHILFTFLPPSARKLKMILGQYGFLILIFIIFFFPPFFNLLIISVNALFGLIVGTAGL